MSVRYDDRGKYFTEIITKDRVPATVQTIVSRIQGNLHVRIDDRIKDELNRGEHFLAITDAIIYNLQGQKTYDTEFMLINRDHIIWIIPQEVNLPNDQQSKDEA